MSVSSVHLKIKVKKVVNLHMTAKCIILSMKTSHKLVWSRVNNNI